MTSETDYEFVTGRVGFELEMFLSSDSGRQKHVDLTEQGAWLIEPIARGLRALPEADGAALGRLFYLGEVPGTAPDRFTIDVGPPDEPFEADIARRKIMGLTSLAIRLAQLTNAALSATEDPQAVVEQFSAPPDGRDFITRDLVRLLNAVGHGEALEDAEWSGVWTDAFKEIRKELESDD